MNPEWVEAGARAYISAPWGIDPVVTAVIAAVEPLIRADERERMKCSHCGRNPQWNNVDTRRGVEAHPWCDCDRTPEVDGHWCDDGCPPRAADITDLHHPEDEG